MAAPPLRADAAENRARILAVARAEITADPDVKLNAIAQRAGVGQATLYRHFPTRADLLAEVYRADVDALVETADTLLADHDPLTALHRWFDRVAEYAAVKRGVFAALEGGTGKDLAAHSHGPIGDAVTRLLDAGRAAGTIRPDVDARDVIILIGYLSAWNRPSSTIGPVACSASSSTASAHPADSRSPTRTRRRPR